MRWEDERYVRLYTRDTVDWLFLSFEAQGLLALLLRKMDRAGILRLGKHGLRGLAAILGHPSRAETLDKALQELLVDGCVEVRGDALIFPNFIEAQETAASDAQRKRDERERAQAKARAAEVLAVTNCDQTSQFVTNGHETGQKVTSGHAASQAVTPNQPTLPNQPNQPDLHALAEASGAPNEDVAVHQGKRKKQADPRHAPVRRMLCLVFREIRGAEYGFDGGKDARAVTRLLALADDAEIERRWRAALTASQRGDRCDSIAVFASRWNAFANAAESPAANTRVCELCEGAANNGSVWGHWLCTPHQAALDREANPGSAAEVAAWISKRRPAA